MNCFQPFNFVVSGILLFSLCVLGQVDTSKQTTINWGTHFGPAGVKQLGAPYVNPSGTAQVLQSLDAAGTNKASLVSDTIGSTRIGDLIELGFFDLDTDNSDTTFTPNTTDDLFKGIWTPLTSLTTIGQQNTGSAVTAGYFGFETVFSDHDTYLSDFDNTARTNTTSSGTNYVITDDQPTNLRYMIEGLNAASNANIGMRFYDVNVGSATGLDSDGKTSGSTRYNTIMNTGWDWAGKGGILNMSLYDSSNPTALDTGLAFEFDNSTYNSTAYIGTGGTNTVGTDDYVATITYHNGNDNLDLTNSSGIGDAIFSGLDGTGTFNGGNDGNQITLNSGTGNAVPSGDLGFNFSGDLFTNSSTSTDLTILKTGAGVQTLSGNINTADSDSTESGYLNVAEGSLSLNPASGKTQAVEFITGAATNGALILDNTGRSDQAIELGFANTAEKKTFSGAVTLSGSNTENIINVGGGAGTAATADAHQEFSGVVSGAEILKKTGKGKLTLTGSNTNSAGVIISKFTDDNSQARDGGILVAGHANALGSGTTTIEHGKLAVAGGISVTNTIQGQATNGTDQKSVVGGGVGNSVGTITNNGAILNIGDGDGEIDLVSPGVALASSMTNGTNDNQVIAGNHNDSGVDTLANSIGTLKINNVGLKGGGVFDWEITNFAGNNSAGADWDVLQFDDLTFDGSGNFDINIFSVASNGSGGATSNFAPSDKLGTSGYKFLDGSGSGTITWGGLTMGGSAPSASGTLDSGYFRVNQDVFSYYNGNFGNWDVYYDHSGKDFYLQYTVVPEPSTYVMISGLLLVPGLNFIRKMRKNSKTVN